MYLDMANIDNLAVDGCDFHNEDDPGNLQFDWLEVQLKMYRERDMQVSDVDVSAVFIIKDDLSGLDYW